MKREVYHTYQYEENRPGGNNERGEERRDGARGEFWIWAECMRELGARMVQDFFWVHRRGSRRRDVKVKEVECRGIVHKRAKEEGNMQRCGTGRWERAWGLGHILMFLVGVNGWVSEGQLGDRLRKSAPVQILPFQKARF